MTAPQSSEFAGVYVLTPGRCCSGHCVDWSDGTPLVHGLSMANAHYVAQQVADRVAAAKAEALAPVLAVYEEWKPTADLAGFGGWEALRDACSLRPVDQTGDRA